MKPKILFFDIESTNLSANFGYILCFGYKWLGDKKTNIISVLDFKTSFASNPTNDKYVVTQASKILEKADMVVTWYGKRFDLPFINTRRLKHGLKPLPPMAHLDGWEISRSKLKLHSNRLASVSDFLGVESKTPLKGDAWVRGAAGHKPSIKYIINHCKQDVVVLEQVYEEIKNLTTTHPNITLLGNDPRACAVCGHNKLRSLGRRATQKQVYQRLQCQKCGAWSQKLINL